MDETLSGTELKPLDFESGKKFVIKIIKNLNLLQGGAKLEETLLKKIAREATNIVYAVAIPEKMAEKPARLRHLVESCEQLHALKFSFEIAVELTPLDTYPKQEAARILAEDIGLLEKHLEMETRKLYDSITNDGETVIKALLGN